EQGGPFAPVVVYMDVWGLREELYDIARKVAVVGYYVVLYGLPVITRCGRVIREAYHVWGIGDAGILFSQRTGSGGAAALGTTREGTCVPAGSDDREHARGDGA